MIRLAIAGTGEFCRSAHFPSLFNRRDKVVITAIYNRGEENRNHAIHILEERGMPVHIFDNPDDLCESQLADAVLLCLPPEFHPPLACKALLAGKHVFCEKPISNTLDDARQVVECAAKSDVVFHTGFVIRYSNLFSTVMSLIEDGIIGDPKIVWNRVLFGSDWAYRGGTWTNDPHRSGGMLNAWGVHSFDLLQAMAGGYPQSCHAMGGHMARQGTNNTDAAMVNIAYSSGVVGSLQVCRFAPRGDDWWIGCIGTNGMIEAGFFQRKIILRNASMEKIIEPPSYELHSFDGMQQQMDSFLTAISEHLHTSSGAYEGYYATALALCAEESIREQTSINIPQIV